MSPVVSPSCYQQGGTMKNQALKRKWLALFAVLFVAVCVVGGVVLSAKRQGPKKQLQTKHPKDWLASVPPVLSKVKNLEIVNPRVIGARTDMAGVAFEIVNKSQLPVMAIRLTCGGGLTRDGLDDEDNPAVVIEPYGVLHAEMHDELTPNAPIVISAATLDRKS